MTGRALFAIAALAVSNGGAQNASDAERAIRDGELDEARAMYETLYESDPRNADYALGVGKTAFFLGDAEAARDHLAVAIALAPMYWDAYALLANVHASLGRYDSAAAAIAPAFEANPKRSDYARRYADYLASANDFERLREALETIDRMETPPPISDATRRLALRRSARLVGAYHANDLIDDWRETEAAFGFAPTTDFSAETSLFVAERFETNDALFAVVAYWKPSEWAVARGGVAKGFERTFLPAWRLEAGATAYPLDGASVFVGFTYFEFDRERVRLYSGGVEAGLWRGSYARAQFYSADEDASYALSLGWRGDDARAAIGFATGEEAYQSALVPEQLFAETESAFLRAEWFFAVEWAVRLGVAVVDRKGSYRSDKYEAGVVFKF
ncbi:MAG: YaiO family outer membrane beta-barrel protein [Ignavibacteriales bacterium]|nr:YaiO family outer membrane beta-barrel protein [Ignavibacteriales bacterium]